MVKKSQYSFIIICLAVLIISPFISTRTNAKAAESKSYLIINKAENKLAYFKNGELIKTFDVATGKSRSLTPEGSFTIVNKIKNRPYYKKKIPGGVPSNPLGDRWLGLSVPGTGGNTYGIHGNSNENSIGKYVSAGCIRMHNEDVRWLFEQIPTGTPVLITHQKKDFQTLAIENGYKVKQPIIEKVDKKVTTFTDKTLYSNPINYDGYSNGKINPQVVTAFEQTDHGWYHIHTWFGSAWISQAETVEGVLEKVNAKINLTVNTPFYSLPYHEVKIGDLNAQQVKSFERFGDWYHIKTWLGDAWIQVQENDYVMIQNDEETALQTE